MIKYVEKLGVNNNEIKKYKNIKKNCKYNTGIYIFMVNILLSKKIRKEVKTMNSKESIEKIAIVGIGCRFPGGIKDSKNFLECFRRGY